MDNLAEDEALARQMQLEFDREEDRERQDLEMARALSAGHVISDSDSDGEEASTSLVKNASFVSEHTLSDSDSDVTYISEEESNANNSHPKKKKKAPKKRRLSTDSDSDETDIEEERPSTSGRTKSDAKKSVLSSATKRLKRDDTVILDEEESSTSSGASSKAACPYGSKCYRKNASHLAEYNHPGRSAKGSPVKQGSTPRKRNAALSCPDVVKEASPYGFVFTKVTGIESRYNNSYAVHIKDILHPSMGQLEESAQFNYMFDIPWLMQQYPREFRDKPLLVVHGEQREGKIALHEAAHPYPNIKLCQAKLEIMYGTHHSKMMFLLYTNGLRIVIHTSNIIDMDWHQKTQGVWISPLFPRLPESKQTAKEGDSPTFLKRDLLAYLSAYKAPALKGWKEHITKHNMSQAKVFIVGSVPGRHLGEAKDHWGHMKVRRILRQHGPDGEKVRSWPVIGQFSSIGSLGPEKNKWLCAEWLQSLSSVKGRVGPSVANADTSYLKLIFPSSDNVRTSLEGYPAGGSLPYSIQTAKKQQYLHSFFHVWKSTRAGRSRACPHIKSYSRLSPDNKHVSWFIVTSANLSKAAWGALEKNASQLMIRSYEIGVMMLPHNFHAGSQCFPVSEGTDRPHPVLHLPWDVPLTPYGKGDRPWIWDIPWTDKPDTNGNAWVPGRR